MDDSSTATPPPAPSPSTQKSGGFRPTWKFWLLLILGLFLLMGLLLAWWIKHTFAAKPYNPVELDQQEEVVLEEKLDALENSETRRISEPITELEGPTPEELRTEVDRVNLEIEADRAKRAEADRPDPLDDGDDRTLEERRHIVITERELNGFLHKNTDLADKVRIELGTDILKAGAIIKFDEDVPFVGGNTLRCKVILNAFLDENHRLAIYVNDISLAGVPIPNAWIPGGIKGVNLVERYGHRQDAVMKRFADGIKNFQISDGQVEIWLNE